MWGVIAAANRDIESRRGGEALNVASDAAQDFSQQLTTTLNAGLVVQAFVIELQDYKILHARFPAIAANLATSGLVGAMYKHALK